MVSLLMSNTQTSILRLVQAMFNASPNADMLAELSASVESSGGSIIPLANLLADNPVFTSEMYPGLSDNAGFSAAFIENLVGDTASGTNKAFAITESIKLLDAGTSRGELIALAAEALGEASVLDLRWGNAAAQFQNKVAVARAYAIDLKGTGGTLDILQAVTGSVDFSQAWSMRLKRASTRL